MRDGTADDAGADDDNVHPGNLTGLRAPDDGRLVQEKGPESRMIRDPSPSPKSEVR
jgi:hypothetical protein